MSKNSANDIASAQKASFKVTDAVLKEVRAARARQLAKWGWARKSEIGENPWDTDPVGHLHDDQHAEGDWSRFIVRYLGKAEQAIEDGDPYAWREEMLCIAALAVAALESHDRKVSLVVRSTG